MSRAADQRRWSVRTHALLLPALLMLWVAVGLLLVVGATNVANLLLMQGSARAREISIRSALGAPRRRIVRQFASEALLLGIAGGALGSLLGFWSVPALRSLLPASLASTRLSVGVDTVVFAVALSIVTALIFGIVPAFRSGSGPAADALRDRQEDGPARSWLRTAFVTAQVALTVILLTGAALLARSFLIVTRVDPGFDPGGTLAFDLTLPSASYPDAKAHAAFLTRVAENIRGIPGVIAAGASGALPMSGTASTGMVPEGGNPDSAIVADVIPVSTGSLESLRIPLKAGRLFSPKDDAGGMPVMLVSELAARTIWPRQSNPIGRRVTMLDWGEPYTAEIVGLVGDVHQSGPETDIAPAVYYPVGQFPETLLRYSIVLRTAGDPFAVAAAAREQVWRIDRNQPIASMRTMTQTLSAALAQRRFNLVMIGAFSVAALGLAAIGLYGILAFAVNGRTREIGVRMALGAGSSDVARLVWNQGARPVLIGLIVGLSGALLASRTVRSLLFGIEGIDALTTAIVGSVILLAAVAASAGPVRRAVRIDPAAVLRG